VSKDVEADASIARFRYGILPALCPFFKSSQLRQLAPSRMSSQDGLFGRISLRGGSHVRAARRFAGDDYFFIIPSCGSLLRRLVELKLSCIAASSAQLGLWYRSLRETTLISSLTWKCAWLLTLSIAHFLSYDWQSNF
jgi:hypothetical protein